MGEVLLIGLIALVFIGPKQLPEFARTIGKVLNEVKNISEHVADQIRAQANLDLDKNEKAESKINENSENSNPEVDLTSHKENRKERNDSKKI